MDPYNYLTSTPYSIIDEAGCAGYSCMTKVRMMKSIVVFLILIFTTNAAFAFTARHTLENLTKIHHSGKKKTSNLTLDDPNPDSDFKIASCSIHHHVKKQHNSISAMITVCTILTPLIKNGIIPIKTFYSSLNNISDIFIPPKKRT